MVNESSFQRDLYQWAGVAGNATNGTRSYTANGLNQYTAAAGAAVTHDANGNLTGDGTWSYGYDQNNRLRTATKAGTSATMAYDAEGRMRQSVVNAATANLLYDGVALVAEYDAGGSLQNRWVHGPGIDEPLVAYVGATTANKSWLYKDHLGSIVGAADGTGTSTAIYSYGPYGEPNITSGQRFRYTGQQLIGGLDIYYYKARVYSPTLGRFLQTDPIGTADDLNLYGYVGNNPVNRTDPTGLMRSPYAGSGGGSWSSGASGSSGSGGTGGAGGELTGGGQSQDEVQLAMAGVAIRVLGPAVIAVTPAAQKAAEQLINGVSGLKDWVFNEGADSADKPKTPADVLVPNGQPVGQKEGSAGPGVRTVTPGQLDGVIDGLKGLGATPGSRGSYPGDWYDLPNNQGGFGVRDSRGSGRTVDVNVPGVPDVTKIHQKP